MESNMRRIIIILLALSASLSAAPSQARDPGGRDLRPIRPSPTGVILDGRGYILTNHHVVDKVQGIEVHLADGRAIPRRTRGKRSVRKIRRQRVHYG